MIQAVLNKLFKKLDIKVNGEPTAPIYLRRWFIYPRVPKGNKLVPRFYLHRFFTGDNVRDLHDHPWSFDSLILWGGYWEHSFNPEWLKWREARKMLDADMEQFRALDGINRYCGTSPTEEQELSKIVQRMAIAVRQEPVKTIKKWYGPGTFLRRGAAWTHAVELKKKLDQDALEFGLEVETEEDVPCWTIVRTGVKSRSWGFHTDNGWCWWRNYHSGACVCYDDPNETIPGVSK